jgi:hypothetical protein
MTQEWQFEAVEEKKIDSHILSKPPRQLISYFIIDKPLEVEHHAYILRINRIHYIDFGNFSNSMASLRIKRNYFL